MYKITSHSNLILELPLQYMGTFQSYFQVILIDDLADTCFTLLNAVTQLVSYIHKSSKDDRSY